MSNTPLEASIPANNEKIIELYKKVKTGQLNPSPDFQRKLVWKKQHKIKFINTILMNYPFPEIYKAPCELNVDTLELKDLVVDGQQRVMAIVCFIDGNDIFAGANLPQTFGGLTKEQKEKFLNYEVSIRYLKNASKAQIKEIFQRINNTEYSLNAMERLNAQWGDSEFVCFGKQLIEDEVGVDPELIEFKMSASDRSHFLSFFHDRAIFSDNDNSRMLSLQYVLTMIATLVKGSYFRRNDETQSYIELYNSEFDAADDVSEQLRKATALIHSFEFNDTSYWFNKANIFTLICELYKYDIDKIDITPLKAGLLDIERIYSKYDPEKSGETIDNLARYFEYAREAVNEKVAREHRGKIVEELIKTCIQK